MRINRVVESCHSTFLVYFKKGIPMNIIKCLISKNTTAKKYLQQSFDGHIIETGYYDLEENIICVSTQIGCRIGCIFCATSSSINSISNKFIRNLSVEEIVKEVKNVIEEISPNNQKSILFSYMGMGEPFLNYINVLKSIKILTGEFKNSRVTIGTTGISPHNIKCLANEKIDNLLNIHLSLHASNDCLRSKIIPGVKEKLQISLEALDEFRVKKNITPKVNYLLIEKFNDSEKEAEELSSLLKKFPFIVKLSVLNPYRNLKSPSNKTYSLFEEILHKNGIKTCRFYSQGIDIQAGCGQLRRVYIKGNIDACLSANSHSF